MSIDRSRRRAAFVTAIFVTLAACNGNSAIAPLPQTSPSSGCGGPPAAVLRGARIAAGVTYETQPSLVQPQRIYQPDWAGPVLFAPGQVPLHIPPHRFCAVEGEWTVPAAKPTINCSNPHEPIDGSSLWIAIDGWSATFKAHYKGKDGRWHTYPSTDILQAGTESDVPCYHGGPIGGYKTHAYFWIEWSGTRNIPVTKHSRNLTLHPGDRIYVRIAAETAGPHAWQAATLWLINETTGYEIPPRTFRSGCVDCGTPYRRPATLFGNTAEWITEATFYDAIKPSLPNTLNDFGDVRMTMVRATDAGGTLYDLTDPQGAIKNVDWMTWNAVPLSQNGTLLACATVEGAQIASFARAPYVIATPGQQGHLEPKPQRCR